MNVDRQVGVLEQLLAQQPGGVFTGDALPRAVEAAEARPHTGVRSQVCVTLHLLERVECQGLTSETCPNQSVPRLCGMRLL